jgi:hypothetical protein
MFLIGAAFNFRALRTCESPNFKIESQRDWRSTALSFTVTILSTRMPYSRGKRDKRILFVSSAVCIPGQSSSGTIVILYLGGAGLVTCVG